MIDPVQIAEPAPPVRLCEHPGCEAGGDFRAPRSRIELDNYYWFCLDHVRAYNAAWNYYAGMSEREIEAEIRRDTVWQRPSWKLGQRHGPAYEARMRDPFDLYSGKDRKPGSATAGHRARMLQRASLPPATRRSRCSTSTRLSPKQASRHVTRCWLKCTTLTPMAATRKRRKS
jgi:hypothetical protein